MGSKDPPRRCFRRKDPLRAELKAHPPPSASTSDIDDWHTQAHRLKSYRELLEHFWIELKDGAEQRMCHVCHRSWLMTLGHPHLFDRGLV